MVRSQFLVTLALFGSVCQLGCGPGIRFGLSTCLRSRHLSFRGFWQRSACLVPSHHLPTLLPSGSFAGRGCGPRRWFARQTCLWSATRVPSIDLLAFLRIGSLNLYGCTSPRWSVRWLWSRSSGLVLTLCLPAVHVTGSLTNPVCGPFAWYAQLLCLQSISSVRSKSLDRVSHQWFARPEWLKSISLVHSDQLLALQSDGLLLRRGCGQNSWFAPSTCPHSFGVVLSHFVGCGPSARVGSF